MIGALYEFQRRYPGTGARWLVLTEIGRKVWETLDFANTARRMVLVDGLEGRGKTEAARAWCRLHMGEARFVSLKGITGKTNVFRAISKALGISLKLYLQVHGDAEPCRGRSAALRDDGCFR